MRSGMGQIIFFVILLGIRPSCSFNNSFSPQEVKNGDAILIYNLESVVDSLKKLSLSAGVDSSVRAELHQVVCQLEKNYRNTEQQKEWLKVENHHLKNYVCFTAILFGLLILGFPFYSYHRKLKLKYNRLSEAIKHTEWGFLVTKEFITENHIAYDELERLLNREKSLRNITSESYNRLHEALIHQKASSSGRLLDRLTNFDGNFGSKFQQLFPEFTTDELLMATMIHHHWKITDMTTIFHVSLEALRKRRTRLAHKIANKLNKEIDLEEFLTKL